MATSETGDLTKWGESSTCQRVTGGESDFHGDAQMGSDQWSEQLHLHTLKLGKEQPRALTTGDAGKQHTDAVWLLYNAAPNASSGLEQPSSERLNASHARCSFIMISSFTTPTRHHREV